MNRVDGFKLTGKTSKSYQISSDEKNSSSGKRSVSLSSKASVEPSDFGALIKYFTANQCAGSRVRMSANLKVADVENRCGLFMRIDGKNNGNELGFDNMNYRPLKGTVEFKKYEIVLDVDKDALYIACGVYLQGAGKCWLDDLKLDVVSKEIPTTEKEVSPQLEWAVVGANPEMYERGLDKPSGAQFIQSTKSGEEHWGGLMKFFNVRPHRAGHIKLSADVKTEGVSNGAGLWMNITDARGESVAFKNMESAPINGDTDWHHCEIDLAVPEDADELSFGLHLTGSGKFFVRNEKVESSVGSLTT